MNKRETYYLLSHDSPILNLDLLGERKKQDRNLNLKMYKLNKLLKIYLFNTIFIV